MKERNPLISSFLRIKERERVLTTEEALKIIQEEIESPSEITEEDINRVLFWLEQKNETDKTK